MTLRLIPPMLVVVVAVAGASCMPGATAPTLQGTGTPVLFIGNSHTYNRDIPGLVQAFAAAAGPEPIAVMSDANPNFALIDHWNSQARNEVNARPWSRIVLQQGWTPAGACRDTLRLAAKNFAGAARQVGARIAMFQVWAPIDRPAHAVGSIKSYELAAEDANGILLPAAAAFRVALNRNPSLDLYADGLHASNEGAYLAALTIYASLFEKTPVGLPSTVTTLSGFTLSIPAATALQLQQAAADAALHGAGASGGEDGPVIAKPGTC
jgi:hypothetical protein